MIKFTQTAFFLAAILTATQTLALPKCALGASCKTDADCQTPELTDAKQTHCTNLGIASTCCTGN